MSLTPSVIQSALLAHRVIAPQPFSGVSFDRLTAGIGLGVFQWGVGQSGNLALTGMATGLAGGGTVLPSTSKLIVPPQASVVQAALIGAGVAGIVSSSLAVVIANGISQAFTLSGQYTCPVGGVASGADVSRITMTNVVTLISALTAAFVGTVGTGPTSQMLAIGIGNGVANLLLLGTGTGAVTGVPTTPTVPATVPTFSTVV